MEGLQVLRFDPKKVPRFWPLSIFPVADAGFLPPMQVSAHPKVIEWSKSLEGPTK
jgi:hypothetical protein